MNSFIGLFWEIDDTVQYERFPLAEEIKKQGEPGYITHLISHSLLWAYEMKFKLNSDKDYDYYPRGRVNYNPVKKILEVDMDPCLHKDSLFKFALNLIFLKDEPAIFIPPKQDGHYSCYKCKSEVDYGKIYNNQKQKIQSP